jgi:uncharacterized protein
MEALDYILSKTEIRDISIINTLKLLETDCTIPFISRYRKEMTGNLDEVKVEEIARSKKEFDALEKRKKTIIK